MSVSVSVIIVSWNVRDKLRACLRSLLDTDQGVSFEIILIDNASVDGTKEMLESEFPSLDWKINTTNQGLAVPWNQAAAKATGDYLLFLNDDTVVGNSVLQTCVTYCEQHPKTGVLGCTLYNPDGSLQPSVRKLPTVWDQFLIFTKLPHFFPSLLDSYLCTDFDYTKNAIVEQVMGAFFFIPKKVFAELNGFDETFFIWFEEVDFCARVREAGYEVVYTPTTSIVHHGGASFAQVPKMRLQRMYLKSLWYYIRKHLL